MRLSQESNMGLQITGRMPKPLDRWTNHVGNAADRSEETYVTFFCKQDHLTTPRSIGDVRTAQSPGGGWTVKVGERIYE